MPSGLPATGITEQPQIPKEYSLKQNYPNPINPVTTIGFDLPERSRIKVRIYSILGQTVEIIFDSEVSAGYYEKRWSADIASGFYFYRIEAVSVVNPSERFVNVRKMQLLK